MMSKWFRLSALALVVILALAACGGGGGGATTDGSSSATGSTPADAARTFFNAMMNGEGDLGPMLCSTIDETARTGIIQAGEAIRTAFSQSGATLDLSGITFTTQNESGSNAEVVLSGVIRVSAAGTTNEVPFQDVTYRMQNENGWKVCG